MGVKDKLFMKKVYSKLEKKIGFPYRPKTKKEIKAKRLEKKKKGRISSQ